MAETVSYSKKTKEEVGFEHPATGPNHCSQCIYFEILGPKKCVIVEGKIEGTDWCQQFRKGKKIELG